MLLSVPRWQQQSLGPTAVAEAKQLRQIRLITPALISSSSLCSPPPPVSGPDGASTSSHARTGGTKWEGRDKVEARPLLRLCTFVISVMWAGWHPPNGRPLESN